MIVTPAIESYIQELTPLADPLLAEMEKVAEKDKVPIINRASIHFIRSILRYKGDVRHILEIGTAIGYSTIWLAKASPQAEVDSIERDSIRYAQAEEFIKRAYLQDRIHLHIADARDYASQLDKQYDLIFIDAAKGQYKLFFESYAPLLKSGGIIITDNVLFHGHVVEESMANKRIRPMVQKIKDYNDWLKNHPQFETSFIPLGDGLALSIKR